MLKIRKISEDKRSITLRLDGKLNGSTFGELERLCERYKGKEKKRVILDFSGVAFIDRLALERLETMNDDQVTMVDRSIFIEALFSHPKKQS